MLDYTSFKRLKINEIVNNVTLWKWLWISNVVVVQLYNVAFHHTFWIRQYPYNSHIFRVIFPVIISAHSYCDIIFVINLSLRFISPLGRFPEDFFRERTPCTGVLYASPFNSHSLYPLHLSLSLISPSLSITLLLPFSLSPSLSLLSIILFGVSNGRFRPCLYCKIVFTKSCKLRKHGYIKLNYFFSILI